MNVQSSARSASRCQSASLAGRSLLWTMLFPGFFAGYVPWAWFGLKEAQMDAASPWSIFGAAIAGAGGVLLAACIVEFARSGRGTLSPVDPPTRLVKRRLYERVRNPMYLSVALILLGEVLVTRSAPLALYSATWFLCANLFVLGYEEPALRSRFGPEYDDYRRRVPRWIPRLR